MDGWSIRGDSTVTPTVSGGVTYGLDNTERSFAAMNFLNHKFKVENLAADFFSYQVKALNSKGQGIIIPDHGQDISIFYDGVRQFKGQVDRPRLSGNVLSVIAYGPWKAMEDIQLSGARTDATGITSDRVSYLLPKQGLRTSFRALINRAVDLGVPMSKILSDETEAERISAMYVWEETTLSNMSLAAAFSQLMDIIGDGVAWFDYSGTTPKLNITRRDDLTPISYAVGSDGAIRVESHDLTPRPDQKVKRLELKYVKRQPGTGKPQFKVQSSGPAFDTLTDAEKRQVQIITFSGPETVETLPLDDFDKTKLQTKTTLTETDFFQLDTTLAEAARQWGAFKGGGLSWSLSGWNRVISGETADFMRKDLGLKTKQVTVGAWFTGSYISANGLGGCANYLKSIGRLGWNVGGSGPTNTFRLYVSFTVPMINLAYPVATTVWKKLGYQYREPRDGLAVDLRSGRNFTPYEGPVTIARADLSGYNGLQRAFNLTNSLPAHDGMNAMVKSVEYNFAQHRVIWTLGLPSRNDLRGLVNRTKRNPQDNIIITPYTITP